MAYFLLFALVAIALGSSFGGADNTDTPDPDTDLEVSDGETLTGSIGDDMISLAQNPDGGSTVTVDGGRGDDLIDLINDAAYSDPATRDQTLITDSDVNGGPGNDTIHAWAESSVIRGGGGDDTLVVQGASSTIEGGAGNDTLTVDVITPTNGGEDGLSVSGGTGADLFALRINEGDLLSDGSEVAIDGAVDLHAVTIRDFVPGTDRLQINASVLDAGYVLRDVTLTAYDDLVAGASTEVTLVYESDALVRNVTIALEGTTGVTMDDLEVTGLQPVGGGGEAFTVADGATVTGTLGDDTMTAAHDHTLNAVSVAAGGGDDLIEMRHDALFEGDGDGIVMTASTLSGGAGQDTISAVAESSTIRGGDGGDTLIVGGDNSLFTGGNDGDLITRMTPERSSLGSDWAPSTLSGGAGNDTIDAQTDRLVRTDGGDGDDLLEVSGGFQYASNALIIDHHGGDGDDTLRIHAPWELPGLGGAVAPVAYYGDAGSDTFEVIIDEGTETISHSGDSPLILGSTAGTIRDFDTANDQLVINLSQIGNGYSVGEITHTNTADGTYIRVDMVNGSITLALGVFVEGATDLTAEDVVFQMRAA